MPSRKKVSPPDESQGASSGYLGLARKWRPSRFEALVGQDAVAQSLTRALEGNRLVHGHLLAGPRGVGKTTSARILARAVNCGNGPTATPCGKCPHCIDIAAGNDLDVIEIDAASNTGVDNMRELLEGTVRAPFSARYKVYIIDEVHMLSIGAFNALLKTLEEPPPHVMFIFATTELEKIPETIRSRCIVHSFKRLSSEDIVRRLSEVAEGEGLKLKAEESRAIFELIAQAVDGGMRDALVAFDQLLSLTGGKPTVEAARDLLGLSSQALLAETVEAVEKKSPETLLSIIENLVNQGRSLERFIKGLIGYVHTIMIMQAVPSQSPPSMSGEIRERTQRLASELNQVTIFNLLNQLLELEERLKTSSQPRFLVEFAFLRLVAIRPVLPIDDIMNRIQAIPATVGTGEAPAAATPSATSESASRRPYKRESPEPLVTREVASPAPSGRNLGAPQTLAAASPMALRDSSPPPVPESTTLEPSMAGKAAGVMSESALGALSRDELIDLIVPVLPDTQRYLGRYLKASLTMRLGEGALWIQWPRNDRAGSTMIARPESRQALESTLRQLAGKPIRVESSYGEEDLAPPKPSVKTSASPSAPAMSDSMPSAANDDSVSDNFDQSPWSDLPQTPARTPKAAAVASAPAHTLPRVTESETRALLSSHEDFARRARMVRDFFEGTFVDHSGKPIAI